MPSQALTSGIARDVRKQTTGAACVRSAGDRRPAHAGASRAQRARAAAAPSWEADAGRGDNGTSSQSAQAVAAARNVA